MIPYDDLVAALQAWRARQGLPVGSARPAATPPPMRAASRAVRARAARATAGATESAGSAADGRRTPLPLAAPDETRSTSSESIDEHALLEEAHYENEGDDFAMAFAPRRPQGEHHESRPSMVRRRRDRARPRSAVEPDAYAELTDTARPTATSRRLDDATCSTASRGIGEPAASSTPAERRRGPAPARACSSGPTDPCGECEVCRRGGAAVCPLATRATRSPRDSRSCRAAGWSRSATGSSCRCPPRPRSPATSRLAYTLYARTGLAPRDPVVVTGHDRRHALPRRDPAREGHHAGRRRRRDRRAARRDWLLAQGARCVARRSRRRSRPRSPRRASATRPLRVIATSRDARRRRRARRPARDADGARVRAARSAGRADRARGHDHRRRRRAPRSRRRGRRDVREGRDRSRRRRHDDPARRALATRRARQRAISDDRSRRSRRTATRDRDRAPCCGRPSSRRSARPRRPCDARAGTSPARSAAIICVAPVRRLYFSLSPRVIEPSSL